MSSQSRRFIPRLVSLDERALPSVTITQTGSTLAITGDANANQIEITDDGTPSGITVTADGVMWSAQAPVSAIVVSTLGGDDAVAYDLIGSLTTTRLLSVDLGIGDDTFTANLHGQKISGSSTNLGITANGGKGADTLTLNANGANVAPEARMSVNFTGGPGHNAIAFNFDPGFLDLGNVTLTKNKKHH